MNAVHRKFTKNVSVELTRDLLRDVLRGTLAEPHEKTELMKKLTSLLALTAALGLGYESNAQIMVNNTGSGLIIFDTFPPVEQWATLNIAGADTVNTAQAIYDAVQANVAVASAGALRTSTSEQPTQQTTAIHTTFGGGYVWTRPTGNLGTALIAKLLNATVNNYSSLQINYSLRRLATARTETIVAHEVYYSFTGELNSWTRIPELSGGPTTATTVAKSFTVTFPGTWDENTPLYICWVDDNESGGTDDGWVIDNVSFVPPGAPLSLVLDQPVAGTTYAGTIAAAATPAGENPPTSVTFYANGVRVAADTTSPFSVNLTGLPLGSVSVYAVASNATEFAYSQTNVITVREEFVHFTGTLLTENFDSMNFNGTMTPIGWYVSAAPPINGLIVVTNAGDTRPQATAVALNLGLNGDGERALGTQPTGTERNMAVRIKNDTASAMTAINLLYDGEVWRKYTNNQVGLTNFISLDQGTTWIATGFDFVQPNPLDDPVGSVPPTALNGNDPANRTQDIGGNFTLPTVVPPGGVIYIRWADVNDGGDDGTLGIDNVRFNATLQTFNPTVTITNPVAGSSHPFGAPITVSAGVVLANPVTNIVFYHDSVTPGNVISNRTASPYTVSYTGATMGGHTLIAVATDNTGATVTSAAVNISVVANIPASITITNPAAGSAFLVGSMLTNVSASATDTLGTVAYVEFYDNGVYRTSDTNAAYGFDLVDVTAGVHTLTAVAVDSSGARSSNSITVTVTNPPGTTFIVTNGASWKYLDNGTNFGATAWQAPGYDDSTWASGFAELGYGDAPGRPERTIVSFGTNANNKYITTYFRKTFTVSSLSGLTDLTLSVLRDDGAVVYINGTQVFITGSLTNDTSVVPITYTTLTTNAAPDDGTVYFSTNLPTSLLSVGPNTIAVELHQDSITSSDISFDLMLWGNGSVVTGPKLSVSRASATQMTISWGADAAGSVLYGGPTVPYSSGTWTALTGTISGAGSINVPSNTGMRFFELRLNP